MYLTFLITLRKNYQKKKKQKNVQHIGFWQNQNNFCFFVILKGIHFYRDLKFLQNIVKLYYHLLNMKWFSNILPFFIMYTHLKF